MKRRSVLVGLGALAASAASMRAGALFHGIAAPTSTQYTAGKFGLTLDGSFAGWVTNFNGGSPTADVINEAVGTTYLMKKELSGLKYEELDFECGGQMEKSLSHAIMGTLQGTYARFNGVVSACDFANKEVHALTFTSALITGLTFPTLDASSKDRVTMAVALAPEKTIVSVGSGNVIGGSVSPVAKPWTGSAFKLLIDGIDTTLVSKVESFKVKQSVIRDAVGVVRDPIKQPAQLLMPPLVVTMSIAKAQALLTWAQQFQGGVRSPSNEKSGSLQYLNDSGDMLFTLNFTGIGVSSVTLSKAEPGKSAIQTARAELYVTGATLAIGPAAIFA